MRTIQRSPKGTKLRALVQQLSVYRLVATRMRGAQSQHAQQKIGPGSIRCEQHRTSARPQDHHPAMQVTPDRRRY